MGRLVVSAAQESDVAKVAALWHVGWHDGHGDIVPDRLVATRVLSEFEARTEAHLAQTKVAFIKGELAGFYMLDGDELYQFYVDAGFRGQGVAGQLMAAAEQDLSGRVAWLACSKGNARAAGFYHKAGWHRVAEQTYAVETASEPMDVVVWRFDKDLR